MATRTNPTGSGDGGGLIPAEWSAQAADAVVDLVAKVRDRTTRPALVAARALVYGIVIGVAAVAALVITIVLLLRMYDNWVPGPLWIAYAALAVIFMAAGGFCFVRAGRPGPVT